MNKYPLALILLAGSSYAHETGYKHFHEEAAPAETNETKTLTNNYRAQPLPLYASFGIHKTQSYKAMNTAAPSNFHKPTAISATLGYSLNKNFSIEAGGIIFGESDTTSNNGSINSMTETDVRGITLGGRLTHKFGNRVSASLSGGLMFWHAETKVSQTFTSFPGKSSSGHFHQDASDPYWSAGLGFEVQPNAIIKLNYNEYMQKDIFKGSSNNVDLEQSTLSLSIEITTGIF